MLSCRLLLSSETRGLLRQAFLPRGRPAASDGAQTSLCSGGVCLQWGLRRSSSSAAQKQSKQAIDVDRKREDDLQAMLKSTGFFFQSYGIYGGFSHGVDYGPLGALLRQNVRNLWFQHFVTQQPDCLPIDTPILSPEAVWDAAGHLAHFNDPVIQCTSCRHLFRADHVVPEELIAAKETDQPGTTTLDKLRAAFTDTNVPCPNCSSRLPSDVRTTNLMFSTNVGPQEKNRVLGYLRPETAQGIFINFQNVVRSRRMQLPFGVAQIGRAFRNELDPGNFLFRLREFEQMELEYFCHPDESDREFVRWVGDCSSFLTDTLGLSAENIRQHEHVGDEKAHYARATTDLQYRYTFGWKELWGVANRTDFDLVQHARGSGEDLRYRDPHTNEQYFPHVIEPSVGLDRLIYAILTDAYQHDWEGTQRSVLALSPKIAPFLFAIMPIVSSQQAFVDRANSLRKEIAGVCGQRALTTDTVGTIGRRYRRQDQIGTPFCAVIDNQTLDDNTFSVRFRDTMQQVRLPIDRRAIFDFISEHVG